MNRVEATATCRLVAACCPSQTFDEWSPEAWAAMLDDVDFEDARQAVIHIGKLPLEPGKARYIEPGHIRYQVTRIRQGRLEATRMPEPPSGLTPAEYQAWHSDVRHAIASGHWTEADAEVEAPTQRRELLSKLTIGIGDMPPSEPLGTARTAEQRAQMAADFAAARAHIAQRDRAHHEVEA